MTMANNDTKQGSARHDAGARPATGFDSGFDDNFDDAIAGRAAEGGTGLVKAAESRLMALAEDGKAELVRSFDALVLLAHEFAARLDSSNGGPAGGYVRQAADMLGDLQRTLHDRPVQHLLDDGRTLVRKSPEVAVGVAVVAGFIAARLAKAGARRS
jgi:hypothetical protein